MNFYTPFLYSIYVFFGERGDALVKTIHWSFWLLAGIVLSWGKTVSFVYSLEQINVQNCSVLIKYYCCKKASLHDNFWFKFCPCWKSPLLVVGHVFTVSIIRLLRELEGVFSLSLFPFGLFSPSPPIPFFVPAMQDNFPDFLTYILYCYLPKRAFQEQWLYYIIYNN